MTGITPLMTSTTGVSAFSTPAGFNICTYAGATAADAEPSLLILEALTGIDRRSMYFPVQTHSTRIVRALPGADLNQADGILATGPGVLIGVHTADCLPLLLADTEARVIAAVHCGWRGTAAGIVANAISAITDAGANPARTVAAMGPCICPQCFEVGPEVACQFPDAAVIRRPGHKPHVDLARAVEIQLRQAGITAISLPPACSKTTPTLYSVRRQGPTLPHRTLTCLHLTR